jgi:hypothetical protein
MRKLYSEGIDTFQARCREILDLFAITDDAASKECARSAQDVENEETRQMKDLNTCEAKTLQPKRICPNQ